MNQCFIPVHTEESQPLRHPRSVAAAGSNYRTVARAADRNGQAQSGTCRRKTPSRWWNLLIATTADGEINRRSKLRNICLRSYAVWGLTAQTGTKQTWGGILPLWLTVYSLSDKVTSAPRFPNLENGDNSYLINEVMCATTLHKLYTY